MAEPIEELNKTGGRSPMLEAYAQYLDKLKSQGSPDKSGVVVDAVAVKPNGERTSLGYLKERVAALKVEMAKLNDRAANSTANAAKAETEAQELERQSTIATGENIQNRMESNRSQVEAQAETDRAESLERSSQEADAAARSAKREADLLRTQGERTMARAEAEGNNSAYQSGLSLLSQAGDRERVVTAKSSESSSLQGSARARRSTAETAGARHKNAEAGAADAEKRAGSLRDQARGKSSEASRSKLDAEDARRQVTERTLEQELLEKKTDELVAMASQLEFIVAS